MSSTTPEVLATPLSLTGLLDGAQRRLRQHVRSLYLPFAVPLVLLAGVQPIVQLRLNPAMGGSKDPSSFLGQIVLLYAVLLVVVFLWSFVYVAMVVAATDAVGGRPLSPGRAWRAAFDPRMIGTQLLVATASLVGFLFCILPGIYVALTLSLVAAIVTEERRFGVAALRRSATLMKRKPGANLAASPRVRSLLLIVVGSLIGYAANLIVQLPLMAVMMFLMFRAAASGNMANPEQVMRPVMWLQVPTSMLGALVQTVVLLYLAFGIALLYFDIRQRNEGQDLLAEAERLARGEVPAGP